MRTPIASGHRRGGELPCALALHAPGPLAAEPGARAAVVRDRRPAASGPARRAASSSFAIASRGIRSPRSSAVVQPFVSTSTASSFWSSLMRHSPSNWNTFENSGLISRVRLNDFAASACCPSSMRNWPRRKCAEFVVRVVGRHVPELGDLLGELAHGGNPGGWRGIVARRAAGLVAASADARPAGGARRLSSAGSDGDRQLVGGLLVGDLVGRGDPHGELARAGS